MDTHEADAPESATPTTPAPAPASLPVADLDDASIFGGAVQDTHNALQKGPAALADADDIDASIDAPTTPTKRRKKKGEVEPVIVTEEHLADALGLVQMAGGFFVMRQDVKWGNVLDADYKREQLAALTMTPAEELRIAQPLARGFAEHGIRAPWWAQLALATFAVMGPRLALANGIDAAIAKRTKGQEGDAGEAAPS